MIGFRLQRLRLVGSDVADAVLEFQAGLNVVVGPSNTGKTFAVECIDFALGGGSRPKQIPEAKSYESVVLEIVSRADEAHYTLERALRGGDIYVRSASTERVLGAKHQADRDDTLSSFLLSLSGLDGTRLRTNQRGQTRPISFRDIARLMLIDEEAVLSSGSPVLSGQYVNKTPETSLFRFLLTGVDDSALIATPDPKVSKGRSEGRAEVLEMLLSRELAALDALPIKGDHSTVAARYGEVESLVAIQSANLARQQEGVNQLEQRQREAWVALRRAESRKSVLSELQDRFELLRQQYASDLARLEAVSEAGTRLMQLPEERCPVCGALAEHHASEHRAEHAAPVDVVAATNMETLKIETLTTDLEQTLSRNAGELERLSFVCTQRRADLELIGEELSNRLQPKLYEAVQQLRELQTEHENLRRSLESHERAEELKSLLDGALKRPKRIRVDETSSDVGAHEAEDFSQRIEALLKEWHFPNLGRVTFSEDDQDIIVSGQKRSSHGKGVRAITHAAFVLGLLQYCADRGRPFPGVVLIDSPLVVYREPDVNEEGFPPDVKDAFYRSLATRFSELQVIIMENDEPPDDVDVIAHVERFTGGASGRRGFIPS